MSVGESKGEAVQRKYTMGNGMALALTLVLGFISGGVCLIEEMSLPLGLDDCFRRHSEKTSIVETVGESIASFCFGQYMWQASRDQGLRGFNISREAYTWAQGLFTRTDVRRHRRQAPSLRVRREYRRLSDVERRNFHAAVNMLKADTSVRPNMYDALSGIHQGIMTTAAHGGPNFLGFHRVYLLMFENALQQKIPSVTLPYWDSTLDRAMFNPRLSVMFTQQFMGNGFGVVRTGPFARWATLSGPLIRNIGQSGQLFNSFDLARIVSSVRLAQITEPNAPVNSSLEFLHNQVHLWVDGQMGSLDTAAHDPIFWMHHAFVDYIWELFRNNQRRFGVDPARDYPVFVNHTMHMPLQPMGLSNFRNLDGMSDVFTRSMYTYEAAPRCSIRLPDCGSPYLRCVMRGFRPTCVSVDWSGVARVSMLGIPAFNQPFGITGQNAQFQRAVRMNAAFRAQTQMRLRMSQNRLLQNRRFIRRHQQQFSVPHGSAFVNVEGEDLTEGRQRRRRRSADINSPKYTTRMKPRQPKSNFTPALNQEGYYPSHSSVLPPVLEFPNSPPTQSLQNTSTIESHPMENICASLPESEGYQNTFHINGQSDIHQWVYIPVKVIYQRPPTYETYSSYPIINGELEEEDIYQAPTNMRNLLRMGSPAGYPHCSTQQQSGAGKVYISSQGLNYMGTYKEYAVVDHRLSISIATAYVAVKSPEFGSSEVFLNAYDACGRVCQPSCKMAGSRNFQPCSGVFRVTSQAPKLYGRNYGDAVTSLWHIDANGKCPTLQENNVYVQFHCNFRDAWPFGMSSAKVRMTSRSRDGHEPAGDEYEEPETPNRKGMATKFGTMGTPTACHIGNGCILASGCHGCQDGQTFSCLGACAKYASCKNGGYYYHTCPQNTWYDPTRMQCVPGTCFNSNMKQWWNKAPMWK